MAQAEQRGFQIAFVSTGVSPSELASLPATVKGIARDNIGYDFFSYKVGLNQLGSAVGQYSLIVLLNSSVICLEPRKLLERLDKLSWVDHDIWGASKSEEGGSHLQSFLVAFGATAIRSEAFGNWWTSLQPLSVRADVIKHQEIGMSQFLSDAGLRLLITPSSPLSA
jgi:rhamnosyltransferase